MKSYSLFVFALIISALTGISCAHNHATGGLNLSVKEIKIEAWLNLMPGGPGSFHISGEICLRNNESCAIKNLSLASVSVKQGDKQIYSFVPNFNPKIENDNKDISEVTEKNFCFTRKRD